jgi:microcystin-dependent protein
LLCSGSTYSNGSSGGSISHAHQTQGHTLTIAEMPSHNHPLSFLNYGTGNAGYVNYTYNGDSSK